MYKREKCGLYVWSLSTLAQEACLCALASEPAMMYYTYTHTYIHTYTCTPSYTHTCTHVVYYTAYTHIVYYITYTIHYVLYIHTHTM